MMKKIQLCLMVLTAIFATGCPKYRPNVDFKNPHNMVNQFNASLKQQYHDYECYRFGPGHVDSQGLACTGFVQDLNKAKDVRNELLENALPYIDAAYMDFKTDLLAGRDRGNFIADVIELGGTAAVGSIKGKQRSIQLIGIALTALKGGRRSVDLNFYKDQSTPVLISKMNGRRAEVRAIILTRERDDVNVYPMGAAVQSIVDYYNAGTLVEAFTALQQDTAVKTQQAEDVKESIELHGVPISRLSTKEETASAEAAKEQIINLNALSKDDATKVAALKKLQKIFLDLSGDPEVRAALKLFLASRDNLDPAKATDGTVLASALVKLKEALPNDDPLQAKINVAIMKSKD